MMTFITLLGFVVGILIFINLIHAKASLDGIDLSLDEDKRKREARKGRASKVICDAPSRRICPVCRTGLTQEEYLLCAMQPDPGDGSRRQVHIYGCPHCYLSDGVNTSGNRIEKLSDFNV